MKPQVSILRFFGFPAANLSNYVFKLYGLRKIQKYHSTTKWVIV